MIYIELNEQGFVNFKHSKPFDKEKGMGLPKEILELKGYLVEEIPPLKKGYKYSIESDGLETKLILVKDDSEELELTKRIEILTYLADDVSKFYNINMQNLKEEKDIKNKITMLEKAYYEILEVIYNV